jgi:hypothetical protein
LESSFGTLYASSLDLIKKGADETLNKPKGIFIEKKELDKVPETVDNVFIDRLSEDLPKYSQNTAIIRIYILSTHKPHPTLLGITAGAYSFVIFKKNLEETTINKGVREDLEIETILHEIGHLLGAKHSDHKMCVMNKIVDVPSSVNLVFVPKEYCYFDKEAIRKANL